MNSGYVMLHRSIVESDLWFSESFTKAQAWVDLFMSANWKDGAINVRGNIVKIRRGQTGWSEHTMAKRWKWSRNKVRRFLSYLEKEGNVILQKDSLTTITTICNYDRFQIDKIVGDTTNDTTERPQKDHRKTTDDTQYKKVKKVKKVKNINIDKDAPFRADVFLQKYSTNKNLIKDWLSVRKLKKFANTETSMTKFVSQVEKAGKPFDEILTLCCEKSWGSFNAEWLKNIDQGKNGSWNKPTAVEMRPTPTGRFKADDNYR